MEIAIGTGLFTKWDVDVNSRHLAKIGKISISFQLLAVVMKSYLKYLRFDDREL